MADVLEKQYGRVVAVARQTYGSILTAAASIADTVLAVATTDDFDVNGGQVVIAGELYDYVDVDEAASTITLDTGLLDAADEDTFVELYDTEVEGIVVEYVADVLLDDQDPGDVPIEVTVQHGLVNLLAEAVRGHAAEPVVLVRDGEDDWIIWQIDGKLAVDVVIEDLKGGYGGTLQDIYDAADAAAAAAAAAATDASFALTAANGKNVIHISTTGAGPGSTPNIVGDVWWEKDVPTQTITGQWQGLGGTSWQQVTLNNQVIANLDAGKLIAGSAFTNSLSVKTNFTLGDASTNGVIQSYNFASALQGIYLDKFGLVAKGGSITGATIIGGTVQTASSSGGYRAVLETVSTVGQLNFYDNSSLLGTLRGGSFLGSPAVAIGAAAGGTVWLGNGRVDLIGTSGTYVSGDLTLQSGGDLDLGGGNLGGANLVGALSLVSLGGTSVGGDLTLTSLPVSTGGEALYLGAFGKVYAHATPSRAGWKQDVEAVDVDPDALAQLNFITWRYREDVPFEVDDPEQVFYGHTFDQAEELGLGHLTRVDPRSGLDVARPENLPYVLAVAWQKDHAALNEARAEAVELRGTVADLIARIEALEGP